MRVRVHFYEKDGDMCPDFNTCILDSIPNMIILDEDLSKASKKLGSNSRKAAMIVGCEEGFVQSKRSPDEGLGRQIVRDHLMKIILS